MRPSTSGLPAGAGTVATLGTFDGIHLGHQGILDEVRSRARARGLRSMLVTFDRHPLEVVHPSEAPPLLTTREEKTEVLAQSGLDYVAFLRFTPALSRYEPESFVRRVLLDRFRVRELVIGPDHGFGRARSGDLATLRRLGDRWGFSVDLVPEVEIGGEPASSTRVRKLVLAGELEAAAAVLGRPYAARGRVVRGEGRGRELGFPTANLEPSHPRKLLPADGIYAVHVGLRRQLCRGLAHVGPRPAFGSGERVLEVYLLGFEGDLYGAELHVDFLARLREVRAFDGPESLVEEMRRDRERALRFFRDRETAAPAGR